MEKKPTKLTNIEMLQALYEFSTKIHNSYNSDVIGLRKELIANNGENVGKILGLDNMLSKKCDALSQKIDDFGAKFVACQDGWNKKFELCSKERALELDEKKNHIARTIEALDANIKALNSIPTLFEKIAFMQKILVMIGVVGGVLTAMLLYHLLTLI